MILYFDVASPVYESLTSTKYFQKKERKRRRWEGNISHLVPVLCKVTWREQKAEILLSQLDLIYVN